MQVPSSTKIEHRAINILKSIIDEHSTMEYQFNENDKEMSWDGHIWLYKENNGIQEKSNFDGRIPVQIKGHIDPTHKYLPQGKITYPVKLNDLKAYATEKGVLYFQIFLDGQSKEIFYASLYPSKIADYLDAAKNKGNISTYSIPFYKLSQDAEELYIIAKQFNNESTQQGSAYTPLVQNRIGWDDFKKLQSITFTAFGVRHPYDVLLRFSSGDICLYGTTKDDKYSRPITIEGFEHSKLVMGKKVYQDISIGEEIFYDHYEFITDSDGEIILVPSQNLKLKLAEGKFNFKVISSIKELSQDARFLLKLKDIGVCSIAGHELKFTDLKISPDIESTLHYIIDLCITLKMIGFDINVKISYYTETQQEQFVKLVNLRLGAYNNQLNDGFCKYLWIFGEKYVPLVISKNMEKIELFNAIYTNEFVIFLPCAESNDERGYQLPLFASQDINVLSNLYCYDYDILRDQIDNSDINEVTSSALIQCVLIMIKVYDTNYDLHFLDLAEYLLQKLKPFVEKELILLNQLQIQKRQGTFDSFTIKQLNSIQCNDIDILFGKSVLLGDKEKALMYFNQFSENNQMIYKNLPIYKLFTEL